MNSSDLDGTVNQRAEDAVTSHRRASAGGDSPGHGAMSRRPRVGMDQPLADDLPVRPTLRLTDPQAIVVALTTRVTGVQRETQDDR